MVPKCKKRKHFYCVMFLLCCIFLFNMTLKNINFSLIDIKWMHVILLLWVIILELMYTSVPELSISAGPQAEFRALGRHHRLRLARWRGHHRGEWWRGGVGGRVDVTQWTHVHFRQVRSLWLCSGRNLNPCIVNHLSCVSDRNRCTRARTAHYRWLWKQTRARFSVGRIRLTTSDPVYLHHSTKR